MFYKSKSRFQSVDKSRGKEYVSALDDDVENANP